MGTSKKCLVAIIILAEVEGGLEVLDKSRRIIKLSKPLKTVDDIFTAYWKTTTQDRVYRYTALTPEVAKFSHLIWVVVDEIKKGKLTGTIPESFNKKDSFVLIV